MTTKPKIELKSINVHLGLSEETYAYTANLYIDGKYKGQVSNEGHGGCDRDPLTHTELAALNERIAATMPVEKVDLGGHTFDHKPTLESICGDLVADHLIRKDLKRAMARKALYVLDGKLMESGWKGKRKPDDALFESIKAKHPKADILNTLYFEDALEAYRSHG